MRKSGSRGPFVKLRTGDCRAKLDSINLAGNIVATADTVQHFIERIKCPGN